MNEGTVTFTVKQGTTTYATLTSGKVTNGVAGVNLSAAGLAAGSYSVFAAYNPAASNPNFAASAAVVPGTLSVGKVTPTVTWSAPSSIAYGTPLSSAQLNASASVQGTFVYTPGVGAYLPVGANQNLSVTFTPADNTDYNIVTQRDRSR